MGGGVTMTGTIIYLVISFLVSLVFVILGIRQVHSKEPVGINTGEKPPKAEELISVTEWNHKYGRNFIVYGCLLFLTLVLFGISQIMIDNTKLSLILFAVAIIGEIAWLEIDHILLKKKLIINDVA